MVKTVSEMIRNDANTSLFLVDIGVWAFREILNEFPERAINIGIFEDGMISVAAGMALQGMIPTIYGISPFIVERALEQLKLDFGYQKIGGNFITTGAAYDFSKMGYSHYCAEDIGILKMLPGFEFVAPGTGKQFETLFKESYCDGKPTYYRLSDYLNCIECDVKFGKAEIIKRGTKATVIAISTMLDKVIEACRDYDVTILYYTTLEPFDYETLKANSDSRKILLCEPHYEGSLLYDVWKHLSDEALIINCVGIQREIVRNYGTKTEKDQFYNITVEGIVEKLNVLISL